MDNYTCLHMCLHYCAIFYQYVLLFYVQIGIVLICVFSTVSLHIVNGRNNYLPPDFEIVARWVIDTYICTYLPN